MGAPRQAGRGAALAFPSKDSSNGGPGVAAGPASFDCRSASALRVLDEVRDASVDDRTHRGGDDADLAGHVDPVRARTPKKQGGTHLRTKPTVRVLVDRVTEDLPRDAHAL